MKVSFCVCLLKIHKHFSRSRGKILDFEENRVEVNRKVCSFRYFIDRFF